MSQARPTAAPTS